MKNFEVFRKMMMELSEIFDKPLNETKVGAYWKYLEKYTDEQVSLAYGELMEGKFFPRPNSFKEIIEGATSHHSHEAWQEVLSMAGNHGAYASINFIDNKIPDAIRAAGGWNEICVCPKRELHWLEKKFIERYEDQEDDPEYNPGPVRGLFDDKPVIAYCQYLENTSTDKKLLEGKNEIIRSR